MKMFSSLSGYVLIIVITFSFVGWIKPTENTTVALVMKTIQTVTKKTAVTDWTKVAKGDPLASGDELQTGMKSLAVVKFIDNSIVRVREQSQLSVNGEVGGPRALSKNVHITKGAFGFDIKKQKQNEEFRFTSPTSVASIRGTLGKDASTAGFDTVVVVEGLVNLLNTVSNNSVDIPAGYIGFSNPDGTITFRLATAEELADANNLATDRASNEINIELKDGQGNKKDLKIKFKK